ncbi:hypothetical protein POSPLADRAFT_1057960 [Postia placenta MAD-698-R-SB12]|uniref:Uncharacterized protein n=1 Tax=Postia placenta MAD-698-R-SB12 TaxID=670580 RepID=A0A1X6MXE7_9APHY|nr:hypothetical protein POSPLADRAFT_1057960 [Postia placenta MAD-698-R-SB12]OSX61017.1 hypothetical protein POSPLADRAFT_1057960 [Postia placenta MAD-698-R-SB12]
MNTPQTMALGWGSLIVAAGVSYYFARQNINERRKLQEDAGQRPSEKLDWRARIAQEEKQAEGAAGGSPEGTLVNVKPSPVASGGSRPGHDT